MTRPVTETENKNWNGFIARYDQRTAPMAAAISMIANACNSAQQDIEAITGTSIKLVTADELRAIAQNNAAIEVIGRQINGVLTQKYALQFRENDFDIVAAQAPEADILKYDQLGVAPLIYVGVAAVVLLAGGYLYLKTIENNSENEALRIAERMQKIDREMVGKPAAIRDGWIKLRSQAVEQLKQASKNMPSAGKSIFEKLIGSKGVSFGIAGVLVIAAAWLLIPTLRNN